MPESLNPIRPNVLHGKNGVTTQWEEINRDTALEYISKNHPDNRSMSKSVAQRYAADLSSGKWRITHEGIAFDKAGLLIDGRHRLEGIVLADVKIVMLVTRGLAKESAQVLDSGKPRGLPDQLRIMGFEHSDTRTVAIGRGMYEGPNPSKRRKPTKSDMADFITAHSEPIQIAKSLLASKDAPAVIVAVVARALCVRSEDAVRRFCLAYTDNLDEGSNLAINKMARHFKDIAKKHSHLGGSVRTELYRKAQNVLNSYLNGVSLKRIDGVESDLFPLPEEMSRAA